MRKKEVPEVDRAIGERLRFAREQILGLTRTACARSLGVYRTTLANYESGQTPLRFETALRFCRYFIVSEEWLATGSCNSVLRAIEASPYLELHGKEYRDIFMKLAVRQCLDLWSDSATRHIKLGTAFSSAYQSRLKIRYEELVLKHYYNPRVVLTSEDEKTVAVNYLKVLHERHLEFLSIESSIGDKDRFDLWFSYASSAIELTVIIWAKLMGFSPESGPDPTPWLKSILPDINQSVNCLTVPPTLPLLIARLNTATEGYGKKSELAAYLGVALPTVSVWLSGKREPGGETTLRLLEWVQAEEAKQKGSVHASTRPEQRTQSRNRDETETKPSPQKP